MTDSTTASPAPLRVAIVGVGKMGRHHARTISRLAPLAEVVAVADASSAARSAVRELCPSAAHFESLKELVAGARPDVVHICTAPDTHEPLATAAIDAGCHVYVEKPFATTAAAAARLLARAEAKGVSVCVGHQLLFEPAARELLALLPALGQIVHIESYFSFRTVRRSPDGRTPLRADQQLIDILPHSVSLLLRVLEAASSGGRAELQHTEIGSAGTIHALLKRGSVTGTLVVTLEGRPVESFVRVVGTNGTLHADFVRGSVQRLIGPGTSGIDKALAPFRLAWQLTSGTARALGARVLTRQRSYPGLAEIFHSFYDAVRRHAPSPTSPAAILETVQVCEALARRLVAEEARSASVERSETGPRVLVTGGTGFVGRATVQALVSRGWAVRALARRAPAAWEKVAGVEYAPCDVAEGVDQALMADVDVVVHCAAATAGGWAEHERNSVGATDQVLRAAAMAGVRRFVHVSSLAVLAPSRARAPLDEASPLEEGRDRCGPYVWGKLESELLAVRRGRELGIEVKVVRPGAVVDYASFEPPGRLGKRVGNVFVAVGPRRSPLGVVELSFAARVIAWAALRFDEAPARLNLLTPSLPTRAELIDRLRASNPDLTVLWLPRPALLPLSWLAIALQKVVRPGKPAIDVARVFASQTYRTAETARIVPAVDALFADARLADATLPATAPMAVAVGA